MFSHEINTNIFVVIENRNLTNDSVPCFFKTTIKQSISFKNIVFDTIYLSLENSNMLGIMMKQYLFPKIECFDIQQNKIINFKFDGETIKIPIDKKNLEIELNYEYNPISSLQFMESPYALLYLYDWQSWFFSCSTMKICNIEFKISDDFYLFSNISQNNGIIQTNKKDISMLVLLKDCYNNISFDKDETIVNLFLLKQDSININNNGITVNLFLSNKKNDNWLEEMINKITKTITKINNVFPEKIDKKFNIIEGGFNMENAAFGTTLEVNENVFSLIIDTSFWNDNSFMHEFLHCFFQYKTELPDTGRLLLEESIIEYLSVYFYYEDYNYDSIFGIKFNKVKTLNNISIFSIIQNNIDSSTGDGNWKIVYNKTPAIIHQFAQKIGGDNFFVDLLFKYYQTNSRDKIISFNGMKRFFLTNGVTREDWKWFEENL